MTTRRKTLHWFCPTCHFAFSRDVILGHIERNCRSPEQSARMTATLNYHYELYLQEQARLRALNTLKARRRRARKRGMKVARGAYIPGWPPLEAAKVGVTPR